jgi:hypothetical protein
MKAALVGIGLLAALGGLAAAGDPDAPKQAPGKFKVTTKRTDDAVAVRVEKDRAVFSVTSPFGISRAVIERRQDRWPAVVLRLHLKGLERFRVSDGKVVLEAAVSSQDGKPKARVWKDGKEDAPLDPTSAFWVDVRVVGGDGKPAGELPLKGGYFEITLPKAMLEGDPKSITIDWIDFYRQ